MAVISAIQNGDFSVKQAFDNSTGIEFTFNKNGLVGVIPRFQLNMLEN